MEVLRLVTVMASDSRDKELVFLIPVTPDRVIFAKLAVFVKIFLQ